MSEDVSGLPGSHAPFSVKLEAHTPGPWVIIPARPYDGDDEDLEGSFYAPAGIEGSDGNPVCVFGTLEGSGCLFENEADYHLIAAAPDLLAALQELVAHVRGECSWLLNEDSGGNARLDAQINEAIAKALTDDGKVRFR